MAKSIPALVNPALLEWARRTAGYDLRSAAGKLKIDEELLRNWESGQSMPSVAQARQMAQAYRRALAVFFLPDPPAGYDVLREYRRISGKAPGSETPALRYALQTAEFRREVLVDVLSGAGEEITRFGEKATVKESPEEVGARLRAHLQVPIDQQKRWRSAHEALGGWRRAAEENGVLVFQAPKIEVEEMRGAVIPHEELPVILLNTKDSPQGRTFTLLHELVHLWLVYGGHLIGEQERHRALEDQPTEVFCNAAAAAALVPRVHFLRDPDAEAAAEQCPGDTAKLRTLASRYSVSCEVIARRLVTLGLLRGAEYKKMRDAGKFTVQNKFKPGPVAIEIKVLSQVGRPFAESLITAYHREQIPGNRVSDYLGIKLQYLPRVEKRLAESRRGQAVGAEMLEV